MELELGLKISRIVDDFTSTNLVIARDRAGPAFISKETDTMCILIAHLKGYKREYIKIEINEDGTRIVISGEMPVQEMVMVGWKVYKNEVEMRGFKKAFKIPDGVNLDKIKARFNEEESILKISMPKLVKGVYGIKVEEVEEEEAARASPESSHVTDKGVAEGDTMQQEGYRKQGIEDIKESDQADEKKAGESEIVSEKEFGELGTKKVEHGGSITAYPKEIPGLVVHDLKEQTTKKESQEAEKEVPSDSTKAVTDQVIEQKEIPSPPPLVGEAQEKRRLEELEHSTETIESSKSVTNQVTEQKEIPSPPPLVEKDRVVDKQTNDEIPQVESERQGQESKRKDTAQGIVEPKEDKGDKEHDKIETSRTKDQEVGGKEEIQKSKSYIEDKKDGGDDNELEPPGTKKEKSLGNQANQAAQPPEKGSKLCVPIMAAGSAFLVSIIVLVIHLIRTKSPPSKKRD